MHVGRVTQKRFSASGNIIAAPKQTFGVCCEPGTIWTVTGCWTNGRRCNKTAPLNNTGSVGLVLIAAVKQWFECWDCRRWAKWRSETHTRDFLRTWYPSVYSTNVHKQEMWCLLSAAWRQHVSATLFTVGEAVRSKEQKSIIKWNKRLKAPEWTAHLFPNLIITAS